MTNHQSCLNLSESVTYLKMKSRINKDCTSYLINGLKLTFLCFKNKNKAFLKIYSVSLGLDLKNPAILNDI